MHSHAYAAKKTNISFVQIKRYFDNALTNGQRADIRRVRDPDELDWIPAFYRLLPPGKHVTKQWKQVVYLMPFAGHSEIAKPLGRQLALHDKGGGSFEKRLFQIIRSEYPNDMINLRRLLQYIKPTLNWHYFGNMLFFWGDIQKRRLLEEYYLAFEKPIKEKENNYE